MRRIGTALGITLVAMMLGAPTASAAEGDFAGLVSIGGGRSLYLQCEGKGRPTVLLEAGLRNRGDVWNFAEDPARNGDTVFPQISETNRTCEYDRPGTTLGVDEFSRSTPVSQPRSTKSVVRDLHRLLRAAEIPGPYVMVGHSTGGLIIRQFTATYPNQVLGMVFVDAIPETMQDEMSKAQYAFYNEHYLVDAPPEIAGYADLETIDFYRSYDLIRKDPIPPRGTEIAVLSHSEPFGAPAGVSQEFADLVEKVWTKGQLHLASLLPGTPRIVADHSGHYIQVERPALVVKVIRRVLRKL